MRHSIRRQMMVVFVGLIIFILVLMFAANSGFLEEYYIVHKQADLLDMYNSIDTEIQKGDIKDEAAINKLVRKTEKGNLSVIVVQPDGNGDGNIIFSTVRDATSPLYLKLFAYIFDKNQDKGKILKSTDSYKIYKTKDFVNGT